MAESAKHILLAGRHSYRRELERSFFEREGCRISVADDEQGLQEILAATAPQLIILEHNFAGEHTKKLFQSLKQSASAPKLLLILSEGTRDKLDESRILGADDVLFLPLDIPQLLIRAARLLQIPIRRALRVPAALEIKLGLGSEKISGMTRNISTSGLLFCTSVEVPAGTEVNFEFQLPGGAGAISGSAVVARLDREFYQPEIGIGLHFTRLSSLAAMQIRDFIEAQEKEASAP